MRIITYSTKINRENNLTELVKEKAYNYKTENKHLDCAEKIASMICDLFELHDRRGICLSFIIRYKMQDSWHI